MTDTEKWKKDWFLALKPEYKLLWFYILDNCDAAGFWPVSWFLASTLTGAKYEPEEVLAAFGDRVQVVNDGATWWVRDYCLFQYGCTPDQLDPKNNKAHLGVVRLLSKYGLIEPFEGATKPLRRGTGVGVGIGVREGVGERPSESEVITYFQERGWPKAEAVKFWNYYESNGWKVGKNPMRKWRAAAAGWISRNDIKTVTKPGERRRADVCEYCQGNHQSSLCPTLKVNVDSSAAKEAIAAIKQLTGGK